MKAFLALPVIMFMAVASFAASETYDFEKIAVNNVTASGLTTSKLSQPSNSAAPCGALVSIEGSNARFRLDGGLATNATGHLLLSGNSVTVDSWNDARNFSIIGTTGAATASVSYYRGCSK